MNEMKKNNAMPCDIDGMSVAMAYVPWQTFTKSYEPQKALMIGTIFPELDKPFVGRNGACKR